MSVNTLVSILAAFVALAGASSTLKAAPVSGEPGSEAPIYSDMTGTVALENDQVRVQRFVIGPGQATGRHVHAARQLEVFIKGGVLTSKSGRSTVWPDGRVVWLQDAGHDDGSTNTGSSPIELLWLTLKPGPSTSPAAGPRQKPAFGYLDYPNIPGEDVLENDRLIVQRFKMNPGDWEGIHAHNPHTLYIFVKGGHWLSKSKANPQGVPGSAEDGAVAWMDPIGLSEGHQSGNVGKTSTEVVWVSLKN